MKKAVLANAMYIVVSHHGKGMDVLSLTNLKNY